MSPAQRRQLYVDAYMWASEQFHVHKVPGETAAKRACKRFRPITISGQTVRRSERGKPPEPAGAKPAIPPEGEEYLCKLIRARRALKFPVFRSDVITMAKALIKDTEAERHFQDGEVRRYWYISFLGRWGLDTGNQRPLEVKRAEWCTPQNCKKHYDILEDTLVKAGIAVRRPDFDPSKKDSEPIRITRPERIISFDETRIQLDMTDGTHAPHAKTVRDGPHDTGETLAAKGGGMASGVGGSTAAGDSLPGMFLTAGASFDNKWIQPPFAPEGTPQSTIINPSTNTPFKATFFPTPKGGMTREVGVLYFKKNILPLFNPPPDAENPIVVIADGHGSHMTLELIDFCREHHIVLVLRPPHTTHRLQGEDVKNFKNIKADLEISKGNVLSKLHIEAKKKREKPPSSLGLKYLVRVVKPVWESHFSKSNNLKAWERIGVQPFTRCVYWQLLEEEERAAKAVTEAELNFAAAKEVAFGTTEDEDLEDEDEDPALKKATIFSSAQMWDKGPITEDDGREMVAQNTATIKEKRKEAEEKKAKNERIKRAKHMEASIEGSRILAKLADENDDDIDDVMDLTVPQLKAVLTAAGLEYPSGAKKGELQDIAKANGF